MMDFLCHVICYVRSNSNYLLEFHLALASSHLHEFFEKEDATIAYVVYLHSQKFKLSNVHYDYDDAGMVDPHSLYVFLPKDNWFIALGHPLWDLTRLILVAYIFVQIEKFF